VQLTTDDAAVVQLAQTLWAALPAPVGVDTAEMDLPV